MFGQIHGISPPKPADGSEDSRLPNQPIVADVHPWLRYWARIIDTNLFSYLILIPISFITSGMFHLNLLVLSVLVLFTATFIEALLLCTWGTTPGKALFNIRLRQRNGEKPGYWAALLRSWKVFALGMGLGIPLIGMFSMFYAQKVLSSEGRTVWDREGDFEVTHEHLGSVRTAIATLIVIGMLVLRWLERTYLF